MHRATPLGSSFRAFAAGGAGSVVSAVFDNNLIQEMAGNFMKGETRSKIEAPQNYGFSSVTADADEPDAKKGGEGAGSGEGSGGGMGAEAFINFAGGNRSFPIASIIDDRRHRLKGLEKGDTAMFGQREWGQQFHINKLGMFITGNLEKKLKIGLVTNEQEADGRGGGGGSGSSGGSGGGGASAAAVSADGGPQIGTLAASGSGSSSSGSGGGKKQKKEAKGQKHLYDKESKHFFEVTKDKITTQRDKTSTVMTKSIAHKTEEKYTVDAEHDIEQNTKKVLKLKGDQSTSITSPMTNMTGSMTATGGITAGSFSQSSDVRIKTNINDYGHGLAEILQLRPVTYQWAPETGRDQTKVRVGLVGQDVEKIFPEATQRSTLRLGDIEYDDMCSIDTSVLVVALINSVKELAFRVVELEARQAGR